jgi:hypothetical protein
VRELENMIERAVIGAAGGRRGPLAAHLFGEGREGIQYEMGLNQSFLELPSRTQ